MVYDGVSHLDQLQELRPVRVAQTKVELRGSRLVLQPCHDLCYLCYRSLQGVRGIVSSSATWRALSAGICQT